MSKRLVILGAGESGVGTALLAKQKGYEVFVSDGSAIKANFQKELEDNGIAFESGKHSVDQILNADEVMKSPGIPEKNEMVKAIRAKGIPVISEIEFGYRYKGFSKIAAITGSNGKSTATSLLYHICQLVNDDVAMVGNIGFSFARQIAIAPKSLYIIEVSSFQLDDIIHFKPDIAILLNITEDHLDRYEYKFENYIASKFRIFQNADLTKTCIFWEDDEVIQANKQGIPSSHFSTISSKNNHSDAFISADKITLKTGEIDLATAPIQGPHNAINMSAAILAAQSVGISLDKIKTGIGKICSSLFESASSKNSKTDGCFRYQKRQMERASSVELQQNQRNDCRRTQ